MISVEKFIPLLHELLLDPLYLQSWGFRPAASTNVDDFVKILDPYDSSYQSAKFGKINGMCIYWYEEPLNLSDLNRLQYRDIYSPNFSIHGIGYPFAPSNPGDTGMTMEIFDVNFHVFANSEISTLKKEFLKQWRVLDWYFFFHGFAALDWFRDYKNLKFSNIHISKVFICLNHLVSNNRSYRLSLLSHLKENQLFSKGFVSAPLLTSDLIKKEIGDKDSRLTKNTKLHILKNLLPNVKPMILDSVEYNSASADIVHPNYNYGALWHVVTETIYYDEKLHLTEKIFKPIVSRRPFILVGAPGNLSYLKKYGFQTFDRWIDESYDSVTDPDQRMNMIVKELDRLCRMPWDELMDMYNEMQEILDYNHQHFYGKFREILVNELVDNFEVCIKQYNLGQSDRYKLPTELVDFNEVKALLLQ